MKRYIFSLVSFLFIANVATAQIYVSPSSYVFVNNEYMYVKQDVNIQPTGNFYLRNNSQLLQGGTGLGANKGAGDLSVFQEGTVNNFQYNYWCSPVGEALAAAGNNSFGITRLFRPTGVISSTAATITSGFDGVANPLTISTRWIYKFITSSVYAQWVPVGASTTISPGEGFSMKGTSGTDNFVAQAVEGVQNNQGNKQRYDFRGKPNDGDISVAVSPGNFTLVGNPYPSTIDLYKYLTDPANAALINGQAYFWEQVVRDSHILNQYQGGYGVYNPGTNVYTPAAFVTYDGAGNPGAGVGTGSNIYRRFCPVGQGFMVLGTGSGSVTMRNDFRVFIKEGVSALDSHFARTTAATERASPGPGTARARRGDGA